MIYKKIETRKPGMEIQKKVAFSALVSVEAIGSGVGGDGSDIFGGTGAVVPQTI
jgi:hypothetical protein